MEVNATLGAGIIADTVMIIRDINLKAGIVESCPLSAFARCSLVRTRRTVHIWVVAAVHNNKTSIIQGKWSQREN